MGLIGFLFSKIAREFQEVQTHPILYYQYLFYLNLLLSFALRFILNNLLHISFFFTVYDIVSKIFYQLIDINLRMKQSSNAKIWQQNLITAFCFSKRSDYCAVGTKKDHTVRIYRVNTFNNINSWTLLQQLKDHTQTISDIDWAVDNKIVTSSHDRSVYVWKQIQQTKWEKMLVNIDIKLSILVSKWAPTGKKIGLGSSCNTLAIAFYNTTEQIWTISTRNTIVKSPITTVSWHPSSNLIALGSAEFQVKIVTASFKNSKEEMIIKSNIEDNGYTGPFQRIDSLFQVIFSIESLGGWINYISFENNGSNLLVLPHTNHIKIYEIADHEKVVVGEEDIRWNGLPFLGGYINQKRQLFLGGFNKQVSKFVKQGNYVFDRYLDINQKTGSQSKIGLVANITKRIEKSQSMYGKGPAQSEHLNAVKVIQVRQSPVSYDINGIVHFWTEA